MINKYSNFWLLNKPRHVDETWNRESIIHTMVMAEYRRAIANFVKIVTRKNIPVVFNTDTDHSFTTGNVVVISAEIYNDSFDSTVGLALHEATHVAESDFEFFALSTLENKIPANIFSQAKQLGYNKTKTLKRIKDLTNWVEDNRIDALQYKNAPGYRGYYWAMMDRYFNSDIVVEGLKDLTLFRKETLNNYFFRTINIMNPSSDFGALKGLQEIKKILDLPNILRLSDTESAFYLAIELFNIMLKYVEPYKKENQEQKKSKKNNAIDNNQTVNGSFNNSDPVEDDNKKKVLVKNAPDFGEYSSDKDNEMFDEVIDFNDLTKPQQEIIAAVADALKKQEQFLEGNTQKKSIDAEENERLSILGETGSSIEPVKFNASEYKDFRPKKGYVREDSYQPQQYNVIVLRNITDSVFNSAIFPFKNDTADYQNDVNKGFSLGTILGKKLQVRNDEKYTIYTRKKTGKMERRLLSELGFDNTNIFQQTFIEKFTKAILHISVDVSGSMNAGDKFNRCIITVCAIAKAAAMVQNFDVVVSLRGSTDNTPLIAIIYDSRVDKLSKIKKFFPYLQAPSATPEGLAFAAIQSEILSSNRNIDSYFLSIGDGQPEFNSYSGRPAAHHTRGEIEKMRAKGVKIMSYYIGTEGETPENFKIMYGNDGKIINVENIFEIAMTLNKLFTSNEQKITISG